jgi:hypothetical protein
MNALEEALIHTIARNHGCIAEVVRHACQMADRKQILFAGDYADWRKLYEAVTKPETVEGYELTPNDLANLDYGTFDLSYQPPAVEADSNNTANIQEAK